MHTFPGALKIYFCLLSCSQIGLSELKTRIHFFLAVPKLVENIMIETVSKFNLSAEKDQ